MSPMETFKTEYEKLGPICCEEITLTSFFVLMCLLWITRELPIEIRPGMKLGWALLINLASPEKAKYLTDGTVPIIIAILLFIIPSRNKPGERLLDWKTACSRLPWGIVLLLGAGYSLAKAFSVTKFGEYIASVIAQIGYFNPYLLLFVIITTVTFFTEVSSNAATASILMPVLATLAVQVNQNPLFFMIPAVLCCSFAFMLPSGTPPNAIGFSYGYLKIRDMACIGFLLNWLGICVVFLWTFAFGGIILGIHPNEMPNWANTTRTTL